MVFGTTVSRPACICQEIADYLMLSSDKGSLVIVRTKLEVNLLFAGVQVADVVLG